MAAYWLLLLGPLRAEAGQVEEQVTQQTQARDAAVARVAELERARSTYAADYETVVRLGKAIPTTVDMPSLLVQVEDAARAAGIELTGVTPGERAAAVGESGVTAADTQTTRDARAPEAAAAPASGLDTVPLQFTLSGDFFALADFLHRQKRFVRVAGDRVEVSGRLMTVDSFHLAVAEGARELTVDMAATVYLSPKGAPGASAGAPAAPAASAPATASPPADDRASAAAPPVAAVAR
jgi:type IV pilus assembly protein PilO